jgi:hypothetical protein
MSGELLKFLASVVAVPAIVAAAYQLGFRNAGRLADENEAEELFQLAPGAAIIADKGKVIIPGLANLQIDLGEESKGWATIDTDANSA